MTPPGATAAGRRRAPAARTPRGGALAPRAPRRVSGPAAPARVPSARPLAARLAAAVRRAPDHAVTHRLARGRVWIGVLAVALSGIVFMQVTLLRMHASIGRSVERSEGLERSNASLRRDISARSSDDRILSAAVRMGFIQPAAGTPRFLVAGSGDAARAAAALARGGAGADGSALASANADPAAAAAQPQADGTAPPPAVEAPVPAPGATGTAAPDTASSGTGAGTASPATTTAPSGSPGAPVATPPAAAGGGASAGGG